LLNKNISPERQLKAHQHKVANYVYRENKVDHRTSSPSIKNKNEAAQREDLESHDKFPKSTKIVQQLSY